MRVPQRIHPCRASARTSSIHCPPCRLLATAVLALAIFLAPASASAQGSGVLSADPNPCLIPDGSDHCSPLILWESSGVALPKVAITVSGGWGTSTFYCGDANQAGSQQTAGVKIRVTPKTFRLYAVADCAVDPAAAGTLLDEAEVWAYPAGSVVCSVDNQLLQAQHPDYLGLIGNATIPATPNLPLIASELADAGVRQWRRTVQWLQLEPDAPVAGGHTYDWPRFDSLFLPMTAAGIAPWVTLSHTAAWAADLPPGADPADAHKYPPLDLDDWRDFVHAVAERYGPGGILSTPVRHWDIWQEPDITHFFLGTPADYVELLNAAFDEIKTVDPGATVWAGNVVLAPGRPASATDPWIDAIFAGGLFDGFAIHPFFQSVADTYQAIKHFRVRLDTALGSEVPLAVTATSYHLADGPCSFAALSPAERAAYVLDVYACGANAGARHVHWFKTIDRPVPGAGCKLDGNGMFSPSRDAAAWQSNDNLESLRRVGDLLTP
ncbi:MAG: hypothetical protein AAF657_31120 [Acidobacteriota bacterium]